MSDEQHSDVLGNLPHTRAHRRSDKRGARPATPQAEPAPADTATPPESKPKAGPKPKPAPKPKADPKSKPAPKPKPGPKANTTPQRKPTTAVPPRPTTPPRRPPATPPKRTGRTEVLGTAVQAAAELAEIGLSVGARARRDAPRAEFRILPPYFRAERSSVRRRSAGEPLADHLIRRGESVPLKTVALNEREPVSSPRRPKAKRNGSVKT
jgi:outer membrane biosynthesis protein TonB